MTYALVWHRPAVRAMSELGTALGAPFGDRFSARRGDHRVIYLIDEDARVVHVLDLRHRRDAYRSPR